MTFDVPEAMEATEATGAVAFDVVAAEGVLTATEAAFEAVVAGLVTTVVLAGEVTTAGFTTELTDVVVVMADVVVLVAVLVEVDVVVANDMPPGNTINNKATTVWGFFK